jgi:glycosyltransferase involved in cell wall biosynthesis
MWFFQRKPRIERPKVVMTLLVRDEADIIDLFLRYHTRAGIDALIVTDNGSRDGTREILQQYRRDGAIAEIIDQPSHIFDQPRFVDRMIRHARDHYAADYCINSDADEFWYVASGSFRDELSRSRAGKIYCPSYYMLPCPASADFWASTDRCVKRADPKKFGITNYYNLF